MENQPIGYRFIGIEIISRSMTTQPPQGVSGQFNFDIRLEMRVQADISAVIPFVHVDVKDEQTPVASMVVACIFEIEKFKEHIRQNEQSQFEVPQALQSFLAPISISTTRGVLFSEFRGTWLHHAIMPVIPIQQLQPERKLEESSAK